MSTRTTSHNHARAALSVRLIGVATMCGSIALCGCGSAKAPAVASVQGVEISRAALAHRTRIERLELESARRPTSTLSTADVEHKALAFLVTAAWLEHEAEIQGISVSPSEVEASYQQLLSGLTGQAVATGLKRDGMSHADELLQLRLDKLGQKLQAKVAGGYSGVSTTQLANYYHAHRHQFIAPASRRVVLIVTSTAQAARSAKRELQRGSVPADVARRFSIDPTSQAAGGFATFSRGSANPVLDRAIFAAKPGSLVGPVEVASAGSFYVFKVLSSALSRRETLAEAAPTIRQTLLQAGQQGQINTFLAAYRRRWKQRTTCQPGYIIPQCRNGPPLPASPSR